jgi:cytochrome c-type biogenesis protein CcsB
MTTPSTTTLTLGRPGRFQGRGLFDWLYAAAVLAGGAYAFQRYGTSMDVYEKGILAGALPAAIALGWFWRSLRVLALLVGVAALGAISLYAGTTDSFGADLAAGEQRFLLKYFFASQTAFLWMGVLFWMSTLFYWIGVFAGGSDNTAQRLGSRLAWAGVFFALTGTLVRWYESHQIAPMVGHIPVSNLFEVFVLFSWLTAAFYLYFEQHYRTKALGAFVMLIVSVAVGFLAWYNFARGAQEIQPLVPALQSWWMKLHVPANFIGYGTFSLAAMVALAFLIKTATARSLWIGLVALPGALLLLPVAAAALLGDAAIAGAAAKGLRMVGGTVAFFAAAISLRGPINRATPAAEVMDDLMYKSIAVGFAFFTIATVLGALWAAEAWGGYWSWDPKETWALIVWLNYAAWLHMRLMKGLRGAVSAWWALVGLLVTTVAFLGVNMFLSGLHSYGQL